jgi:hypothetical protein
MGRHFATMAAAAAAAALCSTLCNSAATAIAGTHVAAATSGGTWGKAEEVPGTAALNTGGFAVTQSVSCGVAGNCSAGGYYQQASGQQQAFVVSENNGTWGTARKIAGALNTGGAAQVDSVSCVPAGDCGAGGSYQDGSGRDQAFVAARTNGLWGAAREVAGALNKGVGAQVNSVSCASAGNCSAGGFYTDGSGHAQAFVVSEEDGTWGTAREVAGVLNTGGGAQVVSVSCASADDCSAGGLYTDGSGNSQAFVVGEASGIWGRAKEIPGTAALNTGGFATVDSLSCATAGNCSAGGSYTDGSGLVQAFIASKANGKWGAAKEVAGALNNGGHAAVDSVSCPSAGDCSAGGQYAPAHAGGEAFVIDEKNGIWGSVREVPGSGTLNQGGLAGITSVSCASAGDCSAGGFYTDASANQQALVAGETNGIWGSAEEVPGTAALNQGSKIGQGRAAVKSVSCASAAHCGAGGEYVDINAAQQAFADNET